MAMTREQVLAQMESSYAEMTDDEKNEAVVERDGVSWTPTMLLAEVRNDTDFGKEYVEMWSKNQDALAMEDLLFALLGGELMTCGDPNCPNCKGEVRPFGALPGTGTDDGDPTIH